MNAAEVAARFALSGRARLSDGPVARGRQGVVWRLDTADGSWAVKVPFSGSDEAGEDAEATVRPVAEFQEAAYRAGVPTPRLRRTPEGSVFADVGGTTVRLYEWVDLRPPDPGLDPDLIGAMLARMHQVGVPDPGPEHWWYRDPVGADRWDELVGQLRRAGAPFAGRLAALRDELVALEDWMEPAQTLVTCHRDLWADNVLATADGECASSTGRTVGRPTRATNSPACSSSSAEATPAARGR